MTPTEITAAIKALEDEAIKRGIKASFGCVILTTFQTRPVKAYLSVHYEPNIEAFGDDFSDAIGNLMIAINDRAATVANLSAVLGIPVEFAAAA